MTDQTENIDPSAVVQNNPDEAIRLLAAARATDQEATSKIQALHKSLEEMPAYSAAKAIQSSARAAINALTPAIKDYWGKIARTYGVQATLHPAAARRNVTVIEVSDEEALIKWAEKNLPAAVVTTIDKTLMNAHVKAMLKAKRELPPGITVTNSVEITLASDLSPYMTAVQQPEDDLPF